MKNLKKRGIVLGAALVWLLVAVLFTSALADDNPYKEESGPCGEHLTWAISEDSTTLTISGYGAMTDFASSELKPWNDYESTLTTVVFAPDEGKTITHIGNYAFDRCMQLESVTLPAGLESIGSNVFGLCVKISSLTLPESLTSIGEAAFQYCWVEKIAIPASVTQIAENAFSGCGKLTEVSFPAGLTKIAAGAFDSCDKLKTICFAGTAEEAKQITIEQNNTALRKNAWTCKDDSVLLPGPTSGQCGENLTWSFDSQSGALTIAGYGAMTDYESEKDQPWYDEQKNITSIVWSPAEDQTITHIGSHAFNAIVNVSTIAVPEGVTSIGEYAFRGCDKLTSLTLPSTLRTVGAYAFSACYNLPMIAFPSGMTKLELCVLYSCTALEKVTIPASVTTIADDAFSACRELKSVYYGGTEDQILQIQIGTMNTDLKEAKWYCNGSNTPTDYPMPTSGLCGEKDEDGNYGGNLTWSLDLETGEITIKGYGRMADFGSAMEKPWNDHTDAIKKVTFVEENGNITHIGNNAFCGCSNIEEYVLPKNLESVGAAAFGSGFTTINLPDSLRSLGLGAFDFCSSLETIKLPAGLEAIETVTFHGCNNLTEVWIPDSVTRIEESAFQNCEKLQDVYYSGSLVESVREITFGANNEDLKNAIWHYEKTGFSDDAQDGELDDDWDGSDDADRKPVHKPHLKVDKDHYDEHYDGACIKYEMQRGEYDDGEHQHPAESTITYHLYLLDEEGREMDLPGECMVILPYPEGMDQTSEGTQHIVIYHYSYKKGTEEVFDSDRNEVRFLPEGLAIYVDSFSPFVIELDETADVPALPQTGDDSCMALWMMMMAGAAALLIALRRRNGVCR